MTSSLPGQQDPDCQFKHSSEDIKAIQHLPESGPRAMRPSDACPSDARAGLQHVQAWVLRSGAQLPLPPRPRARPRTCAVGRGLAAATTGELWLRRLQWGTRVWRGVLNSRGRRKLEIRGWQRGKLSTADAFGWWHSALVVWVLTRSRCCLFDNLPASLLTPPMLLPLIVCTHCLCMHSSPSF